MSNEAKHTPHTPTPWRVMHCNSGEGCWCRVISGPTDDPDDFAVPSGSVTTADAHLIVRAVNSYEATQRLLDECESFLTRINQLASPDPERTFDNAITDLGYIADYARTALTAIAEHRKAKP